MIGNHLIQDEDGKWILVDEIEYLSYLKHKEDNQPYIWGGEIIKL